MKDVQPYSRLDPEAYRLAVSRYFSHPEDEAVIENAFSDVLAGKSTAYEARMKAGNSGYIWCRIFVTPVMESGVPARMVGVITDISDMKEQTDCLRQAVKLDAFTGLYNKEHTIKLITENLRRESHMRHALIPTACNGILITSKALIFCLFACIEADFVWGIYNVIFYPMFVQGRTPLNSFDTTNTIRLKTYPISGATLFKKRNKD